MSDQVTAAEWQAAIKQRNDLLEEMEQKIAQLQAELTDVCLAFEAQKHGAQRYRRELDQYADTLRRVREKVEDIRNLIQFSGDYKAEGANLYEMAVRTIVFIDSSKKESK